MIDTSSLKKWVLNEQRILNGTKRGRRSPEQVEKLAKIGIVRCEKNFLEQHWEERYAELKQYVEVHGKLPGSRDHASLYRWMQNEIGKYGKGQLSEEQIQKFRAVGVLPQLQERNEKPITVSKTVRMQGNSQSQKAVNG